MKVWEAVTGAGQWSRDGGDVRRIEIVLAVARVFLAACFLAAVVVEQPETSSTAGLSQVLTGVFFATAVAVLATAILLPSTLSVLAVVSHTLDLAAAFSLASLAGQTGSLFFLLSMFAIIAAAYRWGLRLTMVTAGLTVVFLLVESLMVPDASPEPGRLSHLIARIGYAVIAGLLTGYLAEHEKQHRLELGAVATLIGRVQNERGLQAAMQVVTSEILRQFDARHMVLALQDSFGDRAFIWEASRSADGDVVVRGYEPPFAQLRTYLFEAPRMFSVSMRPNPVRGGNPQIQAWSADGRPVSADAWHPPGTLQSRHSYRSLLSVEANFKDEWIGRLFLFDPAETRQRDLFFLDHLVQQVNPAIYNVYLFRRLRSRANAIERTRVARALHDGVIQSLIGIEMQLEVVRRSNASVAEDVSRVQELMRNEVLNLRDLMHQMKPVDVNPARLVDYLTEMTDRFRRDTGIQAAFVSDRDEIALPARSCREIAGIVQEGLANIRKHARAQAVSVRLGMMDNAWLLEIADDGVGFGFPGTRSLSELDASHTGPTLIKERVRALGADLWIHSGAGRGARLEIRLPGRTNA